MVADKDAITQAGSVNRQVTLPIQLVDFTIFLTTCMTKRMHFNLLSINAS